VPKADDKVLVNYEGRLIDGTVFDASKKHGDKPSSFRPSQVIKGWQEALTLMPVGSKWQLFIPYSLAYGERDMGEIKPYSALVFDVELVGIDN
jgi:FKBP-type peptidyl-prolyl cis-trans isomerase FklB